MSDVAIIGMSAVLPMASTLGQFHENLANKVDSVRQMPVQRRKYSRVALDDYQISGFLDRVDEFDHKFFHISLRDAERMDPQQRFLLEQSCAAIENAGYSLGHFRGSRTGVYVGALESSYIEDPIDASTVAGNLAAPLAGRISYSLDLRGPAMVLDTACSSSLAALHQACNALRLGECDYAIAAGITIFIKFYRRAKGTGVLGVVSPDGHSKAFDASADGTGLGEGAGVVLLKPLERALQDRDVIHAVIKGTCLNQDGGRSNGMTAPSPEAQTDVICGAWERAGIEPDTIGFIEAHGTGTKLGDPIEIEGMNKAFARYTDKKQFCAVSAAKSNIGHLGSAAGIAGLLKVVLALEHRVLYPSLHFDTPNPLIAFDGGAVLINRELRPWRRDGHPLRGCVSSFGVSGTNAHAVLEEAPPTPVAEPAEAGDGEVLVTLSAKSPEALRAYAGRLHEALAGATEPLAEIAYVLNAGRDDFRYRWAWVVQSIEELREQLAIMLATPPASLPVGEAAPRERKVVFLISDQVGGYAPDDMDGPGWMRFRHLRDEMASPEEDRAERPHLSAYRALYALCRVLDGLGLTPSTLIGTGLGNLVVGTVLGRYGLDAGLAKAAAFEPPAAPLNEDRLAQVVQSLCKDGTPVFVEIGPAGSLRRALQRLRPDIPIVSTWPSSGGGSLSDTLAKVYRYGATIDWTKHYQGQRRRRVVLPTYPFERIRCWMGDPLTDAELASVRADGEQAPAATELRRASDASWSTVVTEADATDTERRLAVLWGEVLKVSEVSRESVFMELGGDSLNGVQLLERIEETFGADLDVIDLFDYASLSEMAQQIEAVRPEAARAPAAKDAAQALIPVLGGSSGPLSSTQNQMYYLCQLDPSRALYSVAMTFRILGRPDVEAFRTSLAAVVRRHSVLRTIYSSDGPTQHVQAPERFQLHVVDVRASSEQGAADAPNATDAEARARAMSAEERARPFDLETDISLRVTLYRVEEEVSILDLIVHHIASDGWSLGIFLRELVALYRASVTGEGARLPALPAQYIDYARWQRERVDSGALDRDVRYWVDRLTPLPEPLRLPQLANTSAPGAAHGVRMSRMMSKPVSSAIHDFSQGEESTVFMTLLAGYAALLHRYTGQTDIVVGAPVANRNPQVEHLIGFFTNTLPLRLDLSEDPSFRMLLRRVKATTLAGIAHQEVPLQKIIQVLNPGREASGSPIVQTAFALQNIPMEMLELPGLQVTAEIPDGSISQFDLALSLRETPEGIVEIGESHGRVDETSLSRLLQHLERLLESAIRDPEVPVAKLSYLTPEEQHDVLVDWSDPGRASTFDLEW